MFSETADRNDDKVTATACILYRLPSSENRRYHIEIDWLVKHSLAFLRILVASQFEVATVQFDDSKVFHQIFDLNFLGGSLVVTLSFGIFFASDCHVMFF